MRYDTIIIGCGPAGLEAALTLKNRSKIILVLGKKALSDKVSKAHLINNYLGLPSIDGKSLQQAFLNHVQSASIEIQKKELLEFIKLMIIFHF